MIPWAKFQIPQDAYEWAKGASPTMFLVQQRLSGDHLVLKLNPNTMAWHQEVVCTRGCLISTYEVTTALAEIRHKVAQR